MASQTGTLQSVTFKEAKSGKTYNVLEINGEKGSYWDDVSNLTIGGQVNFTRVEKGQYINFYDVLPIIDEGATENNPPPPTPPVQQKSEPQQSGAPSDPRGASIVTQAILKTTIPAAIELYKEEKTEKSTGFVFFKTLFLEMNQLAIEEYRKVKAELEKPTNNSENDVPW